MKKIFKALILLIISISMLGCFSNVSDSIKSDEITAKALSGNDVVGNLTSPSKTTQSGSINVSFEYKTSATRDVRVSIKNTSNWSTLAESFFQINGTGTQTKSLIFTNIPVGTNYIVEVKLFTAGTWTVLSQVQNPLAISTTSTQSATGFSIKNGKLYDPNGYVFTMRGVNHAHAWFTDKLTSSLSGIAATKANTVRVVLSNGARWTKTSKSEISNIIQKCKDNKMVAVLEVHDTTGYGEDTAAATLQSAVSYWLEMKDVLIGQEKYVIINIGNEPFGNGQSANAWKNAHISAISSLRNAGFTHTLMVDAPNWGQDWENIMRDNAASVFSSDILKNTIFSVHMYEVYNTYDKVNNYISSFVNNKIPLVVGEFAAEHKGMEVKEVEIMERCQTLGVGYLGWSWDGNDSSFGAIDIVNNWNSTSFTTWGNTLINNTNGIKNTSWKSSMY